MVGASPPKGSLWEEKIYRKLENNLFGLKE
jgi:hypothetical protein